VENKVEEWLEKRGQDIKEEWKNNIEYNLKICESPMEKIFLIEWHYQTDHYDDFTNFFIDSQYEIKNYMVDFILYYARR